MWNKLLGKQEKSIQGSARKKKKKVRFFSFNQSFQGQSCGGIGRTPHSPIYRFHLECLG